MSEVEEVAEDDGVSQLTANVVVDVAAERIEPLNFDCQHDDGIQLRVP